MDEISRALGPWPILQMIFGVVILGLGVYSIIRGVKGKETPIQLEDRRAEWLAYEHLKNIEENSFKMVDLLRKHNEDLERFISVMWNRGQGM